HENRGIGKPSRHSQTLDRKNYLKGASHRTSLSRFLRKSSIAENRKVGSSNMMKYLVFSAMNNLVVRNFGHLGLVTGVRIRFHFRRGGECSHLVKPSELSSRRFVQ